MSYLFFIALLNLYYCLHKLVLLCALDLQLECLEDFSSYIAWLEAVVGSPAARSTEET
jgi:hypothetical protein